MSCSNVSSFLASARPLFSALSAGERSEALMALVDSLEPSERTEWLHTMTGYLHRDIIRWAPLEVSYMIFSYLDGASLLNASLVSKTWNRRVFGETRLWETLRTRLGVDFGEENNHRYPGAVVSAGLRYRRQLSKGTAIIEVNHVAGAESTKFEVLDMDTYCGVEYVAAAGQAFECNTEYVVIFVTDSGRQQPARLWKYSRLDEPKITTLRLVMPDNLVVGYLSGDIETFRLRGRRERYKQMTIHGGTIHSLETDNTRRFLCIGASDNACSVWKHSSEPPHCRLRTVRNQGHRLLSTRLRVSGYSEEDDSSSTVTLLTMSKEMIHVFRWTSVKDMQTSEGNQPLRMIPVQPENVYSELREAFFTPGLELSSDDSQVTFIRQLPLLDTQTIGDADIVTVDISSGKIIRTMHINKKIRKLLRVGYRFALLLLPHVDQSYKNLAVFDLVKGKLIGGTRVNHSRTVTPNHHQIALGDTSWLDGFGPDMKGKTALCLATPNGVIHRFCWDL